MGSRPFLPLLMAFLAITGTSFFDTVASADAGALLSFKASLSDPSGSLRNWDPKISPCNQNVGNWNGVLCDRGVIFGLRLENMDLHGTLKFDALQGLPTLRVISLQSNSFTGPLPSLAAVRGLRALFLTDNKLSSSIPDNAFDGMLWLKKLHLAQNEFIGNIPSSIANLPRLLEVRLDNNQFEGEIPEFKQKRLKLVNVSNNRLQGRVPDVFGKSESVLVATGNQDLCGDPISVPCVPMAALAAPLTDSPTSIQMQNNPTIIMPTQTQSGPGTIAVFFIAFLLIIVLVAVFHGKPQQHRRMETEQLGRHPSSKNTKFTSYREDKLQDSSTRMAGFKSAAAAAAKDNEQARLVFVRQDRGRFELQDLLKSSAEVLGTGSLGCSYRASLPNGHSMVVKRYRDMNRLGKEEFDEHMRRLGRHAHPNLLPLVAYYYRKEEKLLVTDYVVNRSLAHVLHGKRGPNTPVLDWPKRLNIIKGVGKGLGHLYEELQMLTVPHGHLKASNVLLNESFEPRLIDYALVPAMNQNHAAQSMVSYKSPERRLHGRTSKKSDMWCFGILILEILTGKIPTTDMQQGKEAVDIEGWVKQFVREGRPMEAFDNDLKAAKAYEIDMLKMLEIGLSCCEEVVDKRYDIEQALDKIEQIKAGEEELSIITF